MMVNGKGIALRIASAQKLELEDEFEEMESRPSLGVLIIGDDPVSLSYLDKKEAYGREIGVRVERMEIDPRVPLKEIKSAIYSLAERHQGVIVQLPLPRGAHADILDCIPMERDVDALGSRAIDWQTSGNSPILPTVAAAVRAILSEHNVDVYGKKAVVVGKGKLVGIPVATWLSRAGAKVTSLSRGADLLIELKEAEIIISGAGEKGIITPEMLQKGVVLIDAGTSGTTGGFQGDAVLECAERCSLFSPVPGGVGPVTVAMLFQNLLTLTHWQQQHK